jgi:2-octaprenylphenol hydroxylase
MLPNNNEHFDIAIIGGGMIGLALARALKDTSLKIAIIEAELPDFNWDNSNYDLRVSAINLGSLNFFIELGIWEAIEQERISAYDKMLVWTEKSELKFTANEVNKPELGFIIENRVIRKCLWQKLATQKNVEFLAPCKLLSVEIDADHGQLKTTDEKTISAKLLIGADGGQSWLRQQLTVPVNKSSYGQTALITTVQTELNHQHMAYQHFLPNGPLALLPLADTHRCSIVWSTDNAEAQQLQDTSEAEFNKQINLAFDKLGQITIVDRRLSFSLTKQHIEQYVQPRVAFIGDAAHTIHPLAGQGVNLGFRDARCLAHIISAALAANKDYASRSILRKYERQRKADTCLFLMGMDALKYLFTDLPNKLTPWRNLGVNLLNKNKRLKKLFMEQALGSTK